MSAITTSSVMPELVTALSPPDLWNSIGARDANESPRSGGAVTGKRDRDGCVSLPGRDRAEQRRHRLVAARTTHRRVQLTEHRDLPGQRLQFRLEETSGRIALARTDVPSSGESR